MGMTADDARALLRPAPAREFGVPEEHHLDVAIQRAAPSCDYVRIGVPSTWNTNGESRAAWVRGASAYLERQGFAVVCESDDELSASPEASTRLAGSRLLVSW